MTIYLAAIGAPTEKVEVATLAEASAAFVRYRNEYMFGGSGMKARCGFVYEGKQRVARVSYNGRVWDANDTEVLL